MSEKVRPDFSAMSLLERLFTAGVLPAFEAAVAAADREALLDILGTIEVSNPHRLADELLKPSLQHRL